ncbi:D-alanyl-D-alanine carboxypeptidase [Clostridium acidisoli DSM 12555]|uniref:D-alanyl-D-alanine carboxypeptidase n=1 Tax=Clostridium acidisoli DSM 12555 TaxID=1121291 RepID=A0A1W1XFM3_9CLOT|nr:M15 family metallopeptidase [Clostridium acidisoli]SMC22766.1 D-alanyl-D-alanine carboxypeptidase [Clostridium acidisoli DSM 12555]
MKKIIVLLINILIICNSSISVNGETSKYKETMKQDILCLMLAYPENIKDVLHDDNGNVYITMNSSKKILYDDKVKKSAEQKFQNTDLQDMMEEKYPLETTKKLMEKDQNPGRCRVYSLFDDVYGNNRSSIEHNLKNTNLIYRNLQFNNKNQASNSLHDVFKEITAIKNKNNIYSAVFPLNGTYNYRLIAGTGKLSPHAYGIAIDLNRDKRDYWKWASREEGQKRLDIYPKEVVDIFQKHNFVWGGKWGHFDTLHFEYRPEIILKAKYFGDSKERKIWYEGAPTEDLLVKDCIKKIDSALE